MDDVCGLKMGFWLLEAHLTCLVFQKEIKLVRLVKAFGGNSFLSGAMGMS